MPLTEKVCRHALVALALAILSGWPAFGEDPPDYATLRDKKLQSEFLRKAPWFTDLDKAKADSATSGRMIFAYLTSSYPSCPVGEMTEKGVFSLPTFAEFSASHVLLCHITSQVKSDPYPNLLAESGGRDFPHIVFMDAVGNVLARHSGPRTVAEFQKTAVRAGQVQALQTKAAQGDVSDKYAFFLARVELGAWKPGEFDSFRREFGELSQEPQRQFDRAQMRCAATNLDWEGVLKAAERIVAVAARDPDAMEFAASAYYWTGNTQQAFDMALVAVKARPGSYQANYLLAMVAQQQKIGPLAAAAVQAALKLESAQPEMLAIQAELKDSGRDIYETGTSVSIGDLTMVPCKAIGKERKADSPMEDRAFLFTRGDLFDHMVTVSQTTGADKKIKCEISLQNTEGVFPIRRSEKPWTDDEAAQIVLKAEPALPHMLKANRLANSYVPPLAVAAVKSGLAIDAECQGLLDIKKRMDFLGWDTFEATAPVTVGPYEMSTYKGTGKFLGRMMRPAVEWQAVFMDKDAFHHVYTLRNYMTPKPNYQLVVNNAEGQREVRRLNRALTQEELAQMVLKAETAEVEARKGRALLAAAITKPTVEAFAAAAEAYRASLKLDPDYVDNVEQLLRCYLFISDMEAGTDNETAACHLGMGVIERLAALSPNSSTGQLALGVYMYRFGAYPWVVQQLRSIEKYPPYQARAQEILGILEATGQSEWRSGEAFDFGDCRIESYERVKKPDAQAPPDGTRRAENCFIGAKDGRYRFNFTYREQTIQDTVTRDLIFARCNQSARVRTFEKMPSAQELKDEILKALATLSAK